MDNKRLERLFNRKIYRKIKSADRQQMQDFIVNVYQEGFTDGVQAVPDAKTVTESELKAALINIKGIGEAKAELIVQEIKQLVDVVKG